MVIVLPIYLVSTFEFNDHSYNNLTVTEKQTKRYDKSDKYLIFTKNDQGEVRVFENTDSLFRGKFNSSDVYGSLEIGKKYNLGVVGYRNGLVSMYENIIVVKEVK